MQSMIPQKQQMLRDLQAGEPVKDVFLLAQARQGQARNGPFWSLTLQDRSGKMEARIWSPQSTAYDSIEAGALAYVEGQAVSFKGEMQVKVDALEAIDLQAACDSQQGVDLGLFVPSSETPPGDLLERVEELCRQHLHYPGWRKLASKVLADQEIRSRLLMAVGGKAIHHAYVGGLLEHTLGVMRLCLSFSELYPNLDREALLSAAVFHDLGKAWELGGGLITDYTDEGRLLGHIQLGLEVLEPFLVKARLEPELVMHFKHMILSHHGEYHFGSPKRPKTAEAMALHYADNLDAKMNQFSSVFAELDTGDGPAGEPGWTPFQRTLERFLYRPKATPNGMTQQGRNEKKENQCLLPLKG